MLKRISVGILAIIIYGIFLELGERLEIPGVHSFVSTAEAIIGRPLTPMSYAGVARRTARPVQWACTTARPRRPLGSVRSGLVSAVTRRATRVSANVAKLQVALENGQTIPLSQMASVQYKLEQPSIWRRGLLTTITVQADVVPGIEAKTVNAQLAPALAELEKELPAGDTIEGRRYRRGERQGATLDRPYLPDDNFPNADHPDGSAAKLPEYVSGDQPGAIGADRLWHRDADVANHPRRVWRLHRVRLFGSVHRGDPDRHHVHLGLGVASCRCRSSRRASDQTGGIKAPQISFSEGWECPL